MNIGGPTLTLAGSATIVARSQAATNTLTVASRASADTQDRLTINADGTMSWGPGNATTDVTLARSGTGTLTLTGGLTTTGNISVGSAGALDLTAVAGTATTSAGTGVGDKIVLYSSGANAFGFGIQSGTLVAFVNSTTVFAVRASSAAGAMSSGANAITLSAAGLVTTYAASGTNAFRNFLLSADANAAFVINATGIISWGLGGANAADTQLSRGAAGVLTTNTVNVAKLTINTPTGTNAGPFSAGIQGVIAAGSNLMESLLTATDTQPQFYITGNGNHYWGAGGTTATDVTLSRSSAGVLTLNPGSLVINTMLTITSTSGIRLGGTNAGAYTAGIQTVLASTAFMMGNFLTSTDTQPAWWVDANGTIRWGPGGTTGTDIQLTRSAAGILKLYPGQLQAGNLAAISTTYAPQIVATTATAANYNSIEWGWAQASYASVLGTTGSGQGKAFIAFGGESGTTAGTFKSRGWAPGIIMQGDSTGTIWFGTVATAAATDNQTFVQTMAISGGGTLTVASNISISGSAAFLARSQAAVSTTSFATRISTDTVDRFVIGADGRMSWGTGAAGATNTLSLVSGQIYISSSSTAQPFVASNTNSSFTGSVLSGYHQTLGDSSAYNLIAGVNLQGGSGNARFIVSGTGQIYSTFASIGVISDAAAKTDIEPLTGSLTTVRALQPRQFVWNGDHSHVDGLAGQTGYGFIADEVEKVLPHLVDMFPTLDDTPPSVKALRQNDILPFLVGAVQELADKLDKLEAKV